MRKYKSYIDIQIIIQIKKIKQTEFCKIYPLEIPQSIFKKFPQNKSNQNTLHTTISKRRRIFGTKHYFILILKSCLLQSNINKRSPTEHDFISFQIHEKKREKKMIWKQLKSPLKPQNAPHVTFFQLQAVLNIPNETPN